MLVIERDSFDEKEFKKSFLGKQAVVYRNQINSWPAISKWQQNYFAESCGDIPIVAKSFTADSVNVSNMKMKEYVELIEKFRLNNAEDSDAVGPYCHDIPIFILAKHLVKDIGEMPLGVLPDWYANDWSRFVQFFMSTKGSVTPLHFDTLMTNNIFFQIQGSKCFSVIHKSNVNQCYRRGWRWFNVNPEQPDHEKHPAFSKVDVGTVNVSSGDMFYMPPGTLHHVRSLTDCISFNIDFHTIKSVLSAFLYSHKGMPKENIRFNYITLKALLNRRKSNELFESYSSYLNYIS